MIQDEVMVGMGRTGRWFASQHYEAVPDMITLGKGLTGGSQALSAVGVQAGHFEALALAAGFTHGGTFTHHLRGRGRRPWPWWASWSARTWCSGRPRWARAWAKSSNGPPGQGSPHVGDVRGKGMFWGVELVADKNTLKPFARKEQATERVWQELFRQTGVIVYRGRGPGRHGRRRLCGGPAFYHKRGGDGSGRGQGRPGH